MRFILKWIVDLLYELFLAEAGIHLGPGLPKEKGTEVQKQTNEIANEVEAKDDARTEATLRDILG